MRLRQLEPDQIPQADRIPTRFLKDLVGFIEEGHRPSGLVQAVLANDLRKVAAVADSEAKKAVWAMLEVLENRVPSACWGSPEDVERWIEKSDRERNRKLFEIWHWVPLS